MSSGILVVALLFIAVAGAGCAGPDARVVDTGYRYGSASSNEGYYGIIESIDAPVPARGGNAPTGAVDGGAAAGVVGRTPGTGTRDDAPAADGERGKSGAGRDRYAIRVRFDDSSHRTVTQDDLDGLRVGDSVRIEDDRVRRY